MSERFSHIYKAVRWGFTHYIVTEDIPRSWFNLMTMLKLPWCTFGFRGRQLAVPLWCALLRIIQWWQRITIFLSRRHAPGYNTRGGQSWDKCTYGSAPSWIKIRRGFFRIFFNLGAVTIKIPSERWALMLSWSMLWPMRNRFSNLAQHSSPS